MCEAPQILPHIPRCGIKFSNFSATVHAILKYTVVRLRANGVPADMECAPAVVLQLMKHSEPRINTFFRGEKSLCCYLLIVFSTVAGSLDPVQSQYVIRLLIQIYHYRGYR